MLLFSGYVIIKHLYAISFQLKATHERKYYVRQMPSCARRYKSWHAQTLKAGQLLTGEAGILTPLIK
ncbi:MAG: hypothetical protein WC748_08095 [Legionellales bacterium]|jgi:hypothetical protein